MRASSRAISLAAPAACALLLWCTSASAQQITESNSARALARAQQLLQQLAKERDTLQAQTADLAASKRALEKKLASAAQEAAQQRSHQQQTQLERDAALAARKGCEADLAESAERAAALATQARASAESQTQDAQEIAALQSELAATQAALSDADQKNRSMYQAAHEVLQHSQDKSTWTSMLQREPFFGLKRVEVENQVEQDERALFEALRDAQLQAVSPLAQPHKP